jgi:hypothetical protein
MSKKLETVKTANLLEKLGLKLTEEQTRAVPEEFQVEIDKAPFADIVKEYKSEIGDLTAAAVKKRFKNAKPEPTPEPTPEPETPKATQPNFDIAAFKQEVYKEITEDVNRQVRSSVFLETLPPEDRDDAEAIINSKINKGIEINEALKTTRERFKSGEKEVKLDDFGNPSPEQPDLNNKDGVIELMEDYIKNK